MVAQATILGDWEAMGSDLQLVSDCILAQCPNTIYFLENIDGDKWIGLG